MSLKDSQDLKALKTQETKMSSDVEALERELEQLKTKITAANGSLQHTRSKIKKLQEAHKEPIVSEHAMLRYFERAMGFDLEEVRQAILTEQLKKTIDSMGDNGTYPINGSGYRAKVINKTIVTVLN